MLMRVCPQVQHRHFNELLNGMVKDAHANNPANAENPRVSIHYQHLREVDRFYELPPQSLEQYLPPCILNRVRFNPKVRVTYDEKTNQQVAKIVKVRVADINIYFPTCPLDCRISVNLEMDWDGSLEELERLSPANNRDPTRDRRKDRLSYRQSHYRVDLTQVTQGGSGPNVSYPMHKSKPVAGTSQLRKSILIQSTAGRSAT
jgi:hypothetical protein